MKIYTDIKEINNIKNPIVTTGMFDGIHLGHQKIITRLKEIAQEQNGETVLFTFAPHPELFYFLTIPDWK